ISSRNRSLCQVESNNIDVTEYRSIKHVERLEEENRLEPHIDLKIVADPDVHADLRGQSVGIAREAGNAVGKAIAIVVWIATGLRGIAFAVLRGEDMAVRPMTQDMSDEEGIVFIQVVDFPGADQHEPVAKVLVG